MKTRFRKVWCASCSTMQFAGECGHARVEAPPRNVQLEARNAEVVRRWPYRLPLILPTPVTYRECVVGADGSITYLEAK